jgi:hypothetical protein
MSQNTGRARPKFDWKLDPLALAALVLSLIAAIAQLVSWVQGPSVRLIPPDRVALYTQIAPDGSVAIRIAAYMSYANVAQASYGDVVRLERATLKIGELESTQRWNAFGELKDDAISRTADAAPQPLPGQSAVTHLTLFTPVPLVCPERSEACDYMKDYISPEELKKALLRASRLQFQFEIERFNGNKLATSCQVPLTPLAREKLDHIVTTLFYATCYPDQPN